MAIKGIVRKEEPLSESQKWREASHETGLPQRRNPGLTLLPTTDAATDALSSSHARLLRRNGGGW